MPQSQELGMRLGKGPLAPNCTKPGLQRYDSIDSADTLDRYSPALCAGSAGTVPLQKLYVTDSGDRDRDR